MRDAITTLAGYKFERENLLREGPSTVVEGISAVRERQCCKCVPWKVQMLPGLYAAHNGA